MAPTPGLAGCISALVLADLEDNVGGHPMPSSRAADTSCQMGSASAPLAHPMASSIAVNSSTELYPVPVRWSSNQPASAASAAKQKLRDTPSSSSCFAACAIPRYWGTAILFTQPAKVTQSARLCGHVVLCSCLKDVLLCRVTPVALPPSLPNNTAPPSAPTSPNTALQKIFDRVSCSNSLPIHATSILPRNSSAAEGEP
jgi:hypothetical protein